MDQLDPHQAVKLFESSLASGLVAEDGQLDFWQLLRSNFDSTIPKLVPVPLSPQGQLGQIRYISTPHKQACSMSECKLCLCADLLCKADSAFA